MRRLLLLLLAAGLIPGCVPTQGFLAARPAVEDDDDAADDDDATSDDDDDDVADDDDAAGCDPGQLDTRNLPAATAGIAYAGALRVEDYVGAATFTQTGGDLPPGLTLYETGGLTGTPTTSGVYEFRVRVTGMSRADVEGCVEFLVEPGNTEPALGYVHEQSTTLTDEFGLQTDLWIRIAGAGEDGMAEITVQPGLYLAGPNGIHEKGGGDDVLQESLPVGEITFDIGPWIEAPEANWPPHTNVGDPTEYVGEGRFVAGEDTGHIDFTMSHPDHGVLETKILVVPPDWCPLGEHYGGPSAPGACEPD